MPIPYSVYSKISEENIVWPSKEWCKRDDRDIK